jgi:flagellar hook-basal body complex protein FliE
MINIEGLSSGIGLGNIAGLQKQEPKVSGATFEQMLKNSIEEVNSTQLQGYEAMSGIATGKVKNLQEAVQRIEEAELSLKLALEVKNKAISAYKEITKMQI